MKTSLGNWTVSAGENGLLLHHASGLAIACGGAGITPSGGTSVAAAWKSVHGHRLEVDAHGFQFRAVLGQGPTTDWLSISLSVRNLQAAAVSLANVAVLDSAVISGAVPLTRHLISGEAMIDYSAMVPTGEREQSVNVTGWSDVAGSHALVVGFQDLDSSFCRLTAKGPAKEITLSALAEREGVHLEADQWLELPSLLVGVGPSLMDLLRRYAQRTGARHGARQGPIATGWCSWYDYYGTETESDILANAMALASGPLNHEVKVIQIDDGWNLPDPKHPRVWGDWTPGAKFSNGMKHTADRIHALGQQAGLWLAPFAVDPASSLFQEHPEWLVQDDNGQPKPFWGVYGLDISRSDVLEFLRATFDRVFNVWGYDYIKIDFLFYGVMQGRRSDPARTSVQVFREAMGVIRAVAGDRFILNCGSPVGPSIGLCDGMRIGPDVSSRWRLPLNEPEWPIGNCCIYAAAVHTIWRQWMHRTWWQNDPDCLVVRDQGAPGEIETFNREFNQLFATEPPYGLSDNEVGFWLRMVWLTGGMSLISENISRLTSARAELLERAYPLNALPVQVVDWYGDLQLVFMRTTEGPLKVGIFNLSERAQTPSLPAVKLGLEGGGSWSEWLGGEFCHTLPGIAEFPILPPRSGRIWELKN